jgi:hypothetical protein
MKVEKLEVGQTVLVKATFTNKANWREVTVKSIGKKYYTLSDGEKYSIEDLRHHDSVYGSRYELKLSYQQIEDEKLANELVQKVRGLLGTYGGTSIELNKLKQILEILEK